MKNIIRLSYVVLCASLLSCGQIFNCVDGEGAINIKNYPNLVFKEVTIGMSAKVLFVKDSDSRVEISTHENLFDFIEVEAEASSLSITNDKCLDYKETPRITIYYNNLEELKINGSSDLSFADTLFSDDFSLKINGSGDVSLPVVCSDLEIKINGSGDVTMQGRSQNTTIKINGSGDIEALQLKSKNAEIKINGSGDVRLWVDENLNCASTGSGDIHYAGSPNNVTQKQLGSGSVSKLSY